jgi:hypothetical protein
MNHKTSIESHVHQRKLAHFDPGTNSWIELADTLPLEHSNILQFELFDEPAFSRPHMQDMIRTSVTGDWANITQDGDATSALPHLTGRYYEIPPGGDAVVISDDIVFSTLLDDATGLPWSPFGDLDNASSTAMYARLATPVYPEIPKLVDPLDSEFSIWYLIRDIAEAPKLVKGIFRSIRRIKSLIGSDPAFSRYVNRHTMKELASLHLAKVYGILPTIADLRDFTELTLKWYKSWRERSFPIGTLRTYKNRRVLPHSAGVPFSRRLRFLAFGASYHFADVQGQTNEFVLNQTMKYYFVAPELTERMNLLAGLVDASGVLDPAALWDAVPFSFVIDWFIDVSKFLHGIKPRALEPTMVVADWAESLTRETFMSVTLDYVGAGLGKSVSHRRERLVSLKVRQTARRRQFPIHLKINPVNLLGKGLSVKRILNGSCIVIGTLVQPRSRPGNYRGNH